MKTCALFTLLLTLLAVTLVNAAPNLDDPRQSIRYWKQYTISAADNPNVATAQAIFQQILRTWNHKHRFLPPKLYVVDSDIGPWAASLADGNILLSNAALNLTSKQQAPFNRDYLAFILAHELAHQQNDDMWHLKFFRLAGVQAPEIRQLMLRGLSIDPQTIIDLENREAKADEDAIVLMSMVGFDPYNIVGDNSFFTQWTESIWQVPCDDSINNPARFACEQAMARTTRTHAKLQSIADKSLLFDLGVQAYVADNYKLARDLFSLFEREYSSHSVLDNIGLTYLAEILSYQSEQTNNGIAKHLQFHYPLMLESVVFGQEKQSVKRGSGQSKLSSISKIEKLIIENTEKAIPLFERAIKINPNYKAAYIHLATSYIMQNNVYMARGILQGKYEAKFAKDTELQLLLSIVNALENKIPEAIVMLEDLAEQQTANEAHLTYSVYFNLAKIHAISGDEKRVKLTWRQLSKKAKKSGNGSLFQLAIAHLKSKNIDSQIRIKKASVAELKLSHVLPEDNNISYEKELWMDGELFHYLRLPQGQGLVLDNKRKITNIWQNIHPNAAGILKLKMHDKADRVIKTLGIPQRQILTQRGLYLAYDEPGIGININNDRISGWFLYQ